MTEIADKDFFFSIYFCFEDRQAWFDETFRGMNADAFRRLVDYSFEQLEEAFQLNNAGEFRRVQGLLLAFARKELEIACFSDFMLQHQRDATFKLAISYYEMAKGHYSSNDQAKVEEAWQSSLAHARDFGYPSVVAEILAPHHIFKDPI